MTRRWLRSQNGFRVGGSSGSMAKRWWWEVARFTARPSNSRGRRRDRVSGRLSRTPWAWRGMNEVVTERIRIGELLLMRESVDPWVLSQTLRNPGPNRQRVVSLLISRAQLDPDDGALALSEQTGYPAALVRHLEKRDPGCANLI